MRTSRVRHVGSRSIRHVLAVDSAPSQTVVRRRVRSPWLQSLFFMVGLASHVARSFSLEVSCLLVKNSGQRFTFDPFFSCLNAGPGIVLPKSPQDV